MSAISSGYSRDTSERHQLQSSSFLGLRDAQFESVKGRIDEIMEAAWEPVWGDNREGNAVEDSMSAVEVFESFGVFWHYEAQILGRALKRTAFRKDLVAKTFVGERATLLQF